MARHKWGPTESMWNGQDVERCAHCDTERPLRHRAHAGHKHREPLPLPTWQGHSAEQKADARGVGGLQGRRHPEVRCRAEMWRVMTCA